MAKSLKKTRKVATRKSAVSSKKPPVSSMSIADMRDFINFIAQTGLNEINLEMGGLKLHVKRNSDQLLPPQMVASPIQSIPAVPVPTSKEEQSQTDTAANNHAEIKSPMIGTFYRSANPKAASFVSVGDTVKKGQVVCIIEAMKLFNEIESEISGTIVKVLVENASPVEYEQPLFLVDVD